MFIWREQHRDPADPGGATVDWGFTSADALQGRSPEPYASFNLARHVGDRQAAVSSNRLALAQELGVEVDHVLFLDQVHGADVVVATGPWHGAAARADAIVTTSFEVAVAVLVADCTPVLLADPAHGVVAAVHAGRAGLVQRIVPSAIAAMRELGADRISAAVGPSICGRCYEVPERMRAEAEAAVPRSGTVSWTGTPAIDIAGGIVEQLAAEGIPLTWVHGCTRESHRLFSHRRQGVTGRFAGVARLRAPA